MGQQVLVAQQVLQLLVFGVLRIFVDLSGQLRVDQDQQSLEDQQVLGDLGVQLVFGDWLGQDNIEIRYLDGQGPRDVVGQQVPGV